MNNKVKLMYYEGNLKHYIEKNDEKHIKEYEKLIKELKEKINNGKND